MSSTSLVASPSPRAYGTKANPSLHMRSQSPGSISPRSSNSPRSAANYYSSTALPPIPVRRSHDHTRSPSHKSPNVSLNSSGRAQFGDDEIHPYANPDLVVSYAGDPQPSPSRSTFNAAGVSRSDSIGTVTESIAASALSISGTRSTLAADASASSFGHEHGSRSRASTFHGREISSPISVHTPLPNDNRPLLPPQPGISNLAGWTERSQSPTFALISLEQARAQRARSATAQTSHLVSGSTPAVPFPDLDGMSNHSPTNSLAPRTRARSISTGARAKQALHNIVGNVGTPPKMERRDSEPGVPQEQTLNGGVPGKTLKHKKSGFMRLFNTGREKEKDGDKTDPPPVPSLSDGYAAFNAQQANVQHRAAAKVTSHRVPVPPVSPSLLDSSTPWDGTSKYGPTVKRSPPPPLVINTSQSHTPRAASAIEDFQTRTLPSSMADREWRLNDTVPRSAPANVSEFPALKLRPVSTIFSAQFGEHIIGRDSQPSLEADSDTLSLTSPTTVISPVTPGLVNNASRSQLFAGEKIAPMATISEDQSSVIRALQEQIVSAKKAWQRHIWELEGQVRDLKAEIEDLRVTERQDEEYCDACGRGKRPPIAVDDRTGREGITELKPGVVNRPRARTGTSSRFGSAV